MQNSSLAALAPCQRTVGRKTNNDEPLKRETFQYKSGNSVNKKTKSDFVTLSKLSKKKPVFLEVRVQDRHETVS
jgi:hypothetical protein